MSNVTVSILTYTALEQARRCIQSVLECGGSPKLILTANGSPEAETYFNQIASNYPNVTVVTYPRNAGFIEPNRHALTLCDTEYMVLLNDDTVVTPGWLDVLEQPFKDFPTAAISGASGTCCSLRPNFHGFGGSQFEYIEGSCMMVKAEIMRKHGLFSPDLIGAYCDDSDLCLRMRELGYTIHRVPLKVKHERFTTSRRVPEAKAWLEHNLGVMTKRWRHYIKVRRFDYPIVLKRSGAWGDVLLLTPVIRELRKQKPLSPIYVETDCKEVFNGNEYVVKADRKIIPQRNELRINLDNSYEREPMTHIVDAYAKTCGINVEDKTPDLFVDQSYKEWASQQLVAGSRYCAIHPGPSTWPGKSWPLNRFVEVAKQLSESGWCIVWIGGQPMELNSINLTGKTNIRQMAAVLNRCSLFIGLDSFPAHCAAASSVASVVLFGITDPKYILTNPQRSIAVCSDPNHPCTGARHKVIGKQFVSCEPNPMETITVEQVLEAIKRIT